MPSSSFTSPQESPEAFLNEMLEAHPLVVISATYCSFCRLLKAFLVEERIPFVAVEINVLGNGRRVFEQVVLRSQCHTVPQVFLRGRYVGGYDDLLVLHQQGKLADFLQL